MAGCESVARTRVVVANLRVAARTPEEMAPHTEGVAGYRSGVERGTERGRPRARQARRLPQNPPGTLGVRRGTGGVHGDSNDWAEYCRARYAERSSTEPTFREKKAESSKVSLRIYDNEVKI